MSIWRILRPGGLNRSADKMIRLIAIPFLIGLLVGCDGGGPSIHYTIPDGYRGLILITPSPTAPKIPRVDGVYQVIIPESGHLEVKSMSPFRQWHSHTASYASGQSLPFEGVNLHYSITDSDDQSWWIVGTDKEKEMSYSITIHDTPLGVPLSEIANSRDGTNKIKAEQDGVE